MNATEHAAQHAEAQRRLADAWHRFAAEPTVAAQMRARATEAAAKSDALTRAAQYHRDITEVGR
ncbi:MAG TPA: hypothetical protein VND19_18715 [Acetobacteraceae bacterium]|nr:hypothetical protein [Acetobacteraceae bacterium]